MLDSHDLVKTIKRAASDANEAGKPGDVFYGTVETTSPGLSIRLSHNLVIPEDNLVLARSVTDYETTVTLKDEYGWKTQERGGGAGDAAFSSHDHDIKGTFKIQINNALKVGERVILIRRRGGQEYVIIDRVGDS